MGFRILIEAIKNQELKNLANNIDNDKNTGNKNKYLDTGEISVFINKVNEKRDDESKIKTLTDFGQLLGFEIKQGQGNTRADYDIAKGLKDSIYYTICKIPINRNSKTESLLNKITKDNVVYVLQQYKKIANNDLAIDVDDEFGLDVNNVKQTICAKLYERSQELSLQDIKPCDSDNIKDVNIWINDVAEKIEKYNVNTLFVDKQEDCTIVSIGEDECSIQNILYNDNRNIVTINDKKDANGTTRLLGQPFGKKFLQNRTKKEGEAANPLNLNIENRPKRFEVIPSLSPHQCPSDVKTIDYIKDMHDALKDHKSEIMNLLNINNKTFDKYAALVLSIAECENEFTKDAKYKGLNILQAVKPDDNLSAGYTALKLHDIFDIAAEDSDNKEYIKFKKYFKDQPELIDGIVDMYKKLQSNLESFGISDLNALTNPENSAIASILFIDARINMLEYVCENDPNKMRTSTGNKDVESRIYASSSEPTFEGVIAGIWNQGFDNFVDGTFDENVTPNSKNDSNSAKYIRKVKEYYQKYSNVTN